MSRETGINTADTRQVLWHELRTMELRKNNKYDSRRYQWHSVVFGIVVILGCIIGVIYYFRHAIPDLKGLI